MSDMDEPSFADEGSYGATGALEVLQVEENEFSSRGAGRLAKGFSASQFPALTTFVCRASDIGSRGALSLVCRANASRPGCLCLTADLAVQWHGKAPTHAHVHWQPAMLHGRLLRWQ